MPLHYHKNAEYVTVLSGTFAIGVGSKNAKMIALPAGSYVAVPAGVAHFVKSVTASVTEIKGMGPMTQTNVK